MSHPPGTSSIPKKLVSNVIHHKRKSKTPELHIERPIYNIEDLHRESQYSVTQTSCRQRWRKCVKSIKPKKCILTSIPVITWLPEYNWKKYILLDIMCGFIVFIMQIPQSMAYGLLANVPPVFGLYMAFYHTLIYFVFGTSRHISMGPFAITCLMTGDVIAEKTTVKMLPNGTTATVNHAYVKIIGKITNTQVGITVAFAMAITELLMYIIRMGIIANLLSDTMVSGFTCAAAFHVAASQIYDLLGLNAKTKSGNFSFLVTVYDLILNLHHANKMAIFISTVSFLAILFNNLLIQPWIGKKCKLFFPMEIVVVIAGTAVSHITRMYETHNITTAGPIPRGLPGLSLPVFTLLSDIWIDAVVISLVAYITTLSVALIFAKKHMYEVNANQELLAYSLCNFIGSFLFCLPTAASLSVSMIQEAVGGVTQVASVVSSILILVVLIWVGPFFEVLPRCILATVIIIALQRLLFQVRAFPLHWRLSRWDGFVWAVTFATTLIVQISIGLAAGVAASLLSVAVQGLRLHATLLGRFGETDLYLDMDHNKAAVELAGIKILHYVGGVSFASRKSFRDLFVENIGFDAAAVLRKRTRLREKGLDINEVEEGLEMLVIILDLSSVTFLDPSGVDYLRHLQSDLKTLGITLLLAECSGRAYESITNCDMWEKIDSKFQMYPTVHDAVLYAKTNIVNFM